MTVTTSQPDNTRDRLLAAAREVFAEQGFAGATVREICRRAEANAAAVNYHFNGKQGLFAEAVNFTGMVQTLAQHSTEKCTPQNRLRHHIQNFVRQLMDENLSPHCQIMARELANPTPALDKIVAEAIAPHHAALSQLVREIVGEAVSAAEVRRCVFSIVGQCLFYRHSHAVIQRLHPKLRYDEKEILATAEHIAEFTLAGLKRLKEKA